LFLPFCCFYGLRGRFRRFLPFLRLTCSSCPPGSFPSPPKVLIFIGFVDVVVLLSPSVFLFLCLRRYRGALFVRLVDRTQMCCLSPYALLFFVFRLFHFPRPLSVDSVFGFFVRHLSSLCFVGTLYLKNPFSVYTPPPSLRYVCTSHRLSSAGASSSFGIRSLIWCHWQR